jgi:hypothetical protein
MILRVRTIVVAGVLTAGATLTSAQTRHELKARPSAATPAADSCFALGFFRGALLKDPKQVVARLRGADASRLIPTTVQYVTSIYHLGPFHAPRLSFRGKSWSMWATTPVSSTFVHLTRRAATSPIAARGDESRFACETVCQAKRLTRSSS